MDILNNLKLILGNPANNFTTTTTDLLKTMIVSMELDKEQYKIQQVDYHYYYQVDEFMSECLARGYKTLQIIKIEPSHSGTAKMHRATILTRKIDC